MCLAHGERLAALLCGEDAIANLNHILQTGRHTSQSVSQRMKP
jgi:hypothetical protein